MLVGRGPGAAHAVHPAVRARVREVDEGEGGRAGVALVRPRPHRRADRRPRPRCGVIALWARRGSADCRSASPARWSGWSWSSLGYLYPARGYLSRSGLSPDERDAQTLGRMLLAAGLSGVPLLGTWAGLMWMYHVGRQTARRRRRRTRRPLHADRRRRSARRSAAWSAAVLGGCFGRRPVYAALCVLSLVVDGRVLPAEHRVRHRRSCSRPGCSG